jgi:hypothetical protein
MILVAKSSDEQIPRSHFVPTERCEVLFSDEGGVAVTKSSRADVLQADYADTIRYVVTRLQR